MIRRIRDAAAIVIFSAMFASSGTSVRGDYCDIGCDWYPFENSWFFVCQEGVSCMSVAWCANEWQCSMGNCNPTSSYYSGPFGAMYCS